MYEALQIDAEVLIAYDRNTLSFSQHTSAYVSIRRHTSAEALQIDAEVLIAYDRNTLSFFRVVVHGLDNGVVHVPHLHSHISSCG